MPTAKTPPPAAPEPTKPKKQLSAEHRAKIARALVGKKHSDETKAKLRAAPARRRKQKTAARN